MTASATLLWISGSAPKSAGWTRGGGTPREDVAVFRGRAFAGITTALDDNAPDGGTEILFKWTSGGTEYELKWTKDEFGAETAEHFKSRVFGDIEAAWEVHPPDASS